MLNVVAALLAVALVAAVKGFSGVAGAVIELARIVFAVAILAFVVARALAPAGRHGTNPT